MNDEMENEWKKALNWKTYNLNYSWHKVKTSPFGKWKWVPLDEPTQRFQYIMFSSENSKGFCLTVLDVGERKAQLKADVTPSQTLHTFTQLPSYCRRLLLCRPRLRKYWTPALRSAENGPFQSLGKLAWRMALGAGGSHVPLKQETTRVANNHASLHTFSLWLKCALNSQRAN